MAGPAGWQGWRPQLLHGPGRGRCAASRVRSVRSRRVGSGSGVRSARPLEPPALQSGQSRWQPQGWRSRVLIARNARGCEGYRADPRQSSFGTCASAGSPRDGSRSPRAAGGVSWRLRVPGRGQAEHAAEAVTGLFPPRAARWAPGPPAPSPGAAPTAPWPRLRLQPVEPGAGCPAPGERAAGAWIPGKPEGGDCPEVPGKRGEGLGPKVLDAGESQALSGQPCAVAAPAARREAEDEVGV